MKRDTVVSFDVRGVTLRGLHAAAVGHLTELLGFTYSASDVEYSLTVTDGDRAITPGGSERVIFWEASVLAHVKERE